MRKRRNYGILQLAVNRQYTGAAGKSCCLANAITQKETGSAKFICCWFGEIWVSPITKLSTWFDVCQVNLWSFFARSIDIAIRSESREIDLKLFWFRQIETIDCWNWQLSIRYIASHDHSIFCCAFTIWFDLHEIHLQLLFIVCSRHPLHRCRLVAFNTFWLSCTAVKLEKVVLTVMFLSSSLLSAVLNNNSCCPRRYCAYMKN